MRLPQKWSCFFSSSQRQVFSPLHHFLYLSYSKECHSLEPCLRQGLTRPQWMTDWMSQLGSYQEKDTDCICCQHPCGYVCVKMSFLGIVCAYVWLSMWHVSMCQGCACGMLFLCACGAQCVSIYFVHVPALTWCIAVCVWILTAWCNHVYLPFCIIVCIT